MHDKPSNLLDNTIPVTNFLRLSQIIGNPKANPPVLALIPVSKSTWWSEVKAGRYPAPVKLSKGISAWRAEDITALMALIRGQS
jgi:predicted DNA-binding transcriptional regulator AlpA